MDLIWYGSCSTTIETFIERVIMRWIYTPSEKECVETLSGKQSSGVPLIEIRFEAPESTRVGGAFSEGPLVVGKRSYNGLGAAEGAVESFSWICDSAGIIDQLLLHSVVPFSFLISS